MANPLDYLQIVVKLCKVRKKDGSSSSDILHASGKKIGSVRLSPRSFWINLLRIFNLKRFFLRRFLWFPFEIKIFDSDDKNIITLTRKGSFTDFTVEIIDSLGRNLGRVTQVKPEAVIDDTSRKTQFNLYDYKGNLVSVFVGDWASWNMQILDANKKTIVRLSKSMLNLSKIIHAGIDLYAAEIYMEFQTQLAKTIVMATAAAMDYMANE